MKYYFPTTTLNFNNILSSESISPADFYPTRGFGYKRWEMLDEQQSKAFIVLYDKLCYFKRPSSDQEDHPLLIEIELEEKLEAVKLSPKDNVYLYRKTIYLTPANSKFFFFSEQDKRIALSLSNHSLETKLIELYRERLTVLNERPDTEYLLSPPIRTADEKIDFWIDKLKGLLYGYYIGGLLSSSPQEVKTINQLHDIENVFSAILSNLDGGVTEHQKWQLETLFTKKDYKSYLKELTNSKNSPEENLAILWIKEKIKAYQQQMDDKRSEHAIKPEAQELTISNYRFSSISPDRISDEKGRELFKVWIEKVFCSPQFNGKISTNREVLSDRLTAAALQFVYDNDDQNPVIVFLEDLRRHVRGNAFNKEWKNSLLFSVAAVLIAGEEWTKLLRYMQGKEMTDYTLAFAIFGCLNGFSALPRNFTDVLYTQPSTYVEAVYNEFHRQLFDKQISIKIPDRQAVNGLSLPSTPLADTHRLTMKNTSNASATSNNMPDNQNQGMAQRQYSEAEFSSILQSVKRLNDGQKSKLWVLYQENQCRLDHSFFNKVININGIGNTIINNIKNVFGIPVTSSTKKQKTRDTTKQPELPGFEIKSDDNFIRSLKYVQNSQWTEKQKKRLSKNWTFTHEKHSNNKGEHIKHFINLCLLEGRGESEHYPELKGVFTPEIGDIFKKEIEEKYDQYYYQ